MTKFNAYAEIKEHPAANIASIIAFFTVAWASMLAVGALGHRWHVPLLTHIGYTDVLLARIASSALRGWNPTKWVVGKPS